MDGGSIRNGDSRGKILTLDLVEKTEVSMETNAWLKVFCGIIWVMGKAVYLVNNIRTARMGVFGGRLGETGIYPNYGHMLDVQSAD